MHARFHCNAHCWNCCAVPITDRNGARVLAGWMAPGRSSFASGRELAVSGGSLGLLVVGRWVKRPARPQLSEWPAKPWRCSRPWLTQPTTHPWRNTGAKGWRGTTEQRPVRHPERSRAVSAGLVAGLVISRKTIRAATSERFRRRPPARCSTRSTVTLPRRRRRAQDL